MIEIFKAILFGIVEGITEWLPVSSTGHMILVDEFIQLDVSKSFMDMLKHYLAAKEYDCVFVSQSFYGRAVKFLKKKYPRILIMTFFHNIELDYALKYLKTSGFRALPFLCAVKIWEKETCLYSDVIITLNNRDSMLLDKIYNRKSDLELPTSFDDKFDECKAISVLNSNSLTIDY